MNCPKWVLGDFSNGEHYLSHMKVLQWNTVGLPIQTCEQYKCMKISCNIA